MGQFELHHLCPRVVKLVPTLPCLLSRSVGGDGEVSDRIYPALKTEACWLSAALRIRDVGNLKIELMDDCLAERPTSGVGRLQLAVRCAGILSLSRDRNWTE
jgi:hypothetical protein